MAVDVAVDRARTSSYKAVAVSCRARPGTAMQGRKVRSPLTAAPARSSREFSSLWPLPSSTRASRGPTANTTYLNTTDTLTRSTLHHTHTHLQSSPSASTSAASLVFQLSPLSGVSLLYRCNILPPTRLDLALLCCRCAFPPPT